MSLVRPLGAVGAICVVLLLLARTTAPQSAQQQLGEMSFERIQSECYGLRSWKWGCKLPVAADHQMFRGVCSCVGHLLLHKQTRLWRCRELPETCGGASFVKTLGYKPNLKLYSVWDQKSSDGRAANAFLDLVECMKSRRQVSAQNYPVRSGLLVDMPATPAQAAKVDGRYARAKLLFSRFPSPGIHIFTAIVHILSIQRGMGTVRRSDSFALAQGWPGTADPSCWPSPHRRSTPRASHGRPSWPRTSRVGVQFHPAFWSTESSMVAFGIWPESWVNPVNFICLAASPGLERVRYARAGVSEDLAPWLAEMQASWTAGSPPDGPCCSCALNSSNGPSEGLYVCLSP
jgi:hypothetical protein